MGEIPARLVDLFRMPSALVFLVILGVGLVTSNKSVGVAGGLRTFFQACNVPPDFWCDSYEIAQRCQVVHQCETFKRDRQPLRITLMFEALCPFCQRFISNHLGNLYNQFRAQIETRRELEIELVPWGNSRLLRVNFLS